VFTCPAPATAADQKLKAPVLHAVNRKFVTAKFTATTRSIGYLGYLLAESINGFEFEHQLIKARLTSSMTGKE